VLAESPPQVYKTAIKTRLEVPDQRYNLDPPAMTGNVVVTEYIGTKGLFCS
jgi:hypothetical protein